MLNDKAQKFDVNKIEYIKRDSNYRIANENGMKLKTSTKIINKICSDKNYKTKENPNILSKENYISLKKKANS